MIRLRWVCPNCGDEHVTVIEHRWEVFWVECPVSPSLGVVRVEGVGWTGPWETTK